MKKHCFRTVSNPYWTKSNCKGTKTVTSITFYQLQCRYANVVSSLTLMSVGKLPWLRSVQLLAWAYSKQDILPLSHDKCYFHQRWQDFMLFSSFVFSIKNSITPIPSYPKPVNISFPSKIHPHNPTFLGTVHYENLVLLQSLLDFCLALGIFCLVPSLN